MLVTARVSATSNRAASACERLASAPSSRRVATP
jgi:hypothetical protein